MLYVGNFSYSDHDEAFDNLCLMPALVEAPNADAALDLFSNMLRHLHRKSDLVSGVRDIYLDSLIELEELPEEPLLLQWQKITATDDGLYSSLSALPGNEDIAEAYGWSDEELVDLGTNEVTAEDVAEALTEAFEALTSDDDAQLDTDEEAFISFNR